MLPRLLLNSPPWLSLGGNGCADYVGAMMFVPVAG